MKKEILNILIGCPIVAFFFALLSVCLGSEESLIYNWTFFFFMLLTWDLCVLFWKKRKFRKEK